LIAENTFFGSEPPKSLDASGNESKIYGEEPDKNEINDWIVMQIEAVIN
jgi:hypothetical protein